MGLESGEFIDDLVETNPVTATDSVTEGAAHIRLVKKTITQTFPGFDKAVTLTPDQLNDAVIKSEAQAIGGIWTHEAALRLANNIPLQGRNAADNGNLVLLRVSTGDGVEFGSSSAPVKMDADADGFAWYLATAETMSLEPGASNGLRVETATGGLARVPTVGDLNVYTVKQQFDAGLLLKNNQPIQWFASDGTTARTLFILDGTNLAKVGNANTELQLRAATEIVGQINNADAGKFVARANGGVKVLSRTGSELKAGFRNPDRTVPASPYTTAQDDEGSIIQAPNAGTVTIDSLEAGTSYLIISVNGGFTLNRGAGVSTLRYLGGLDGVQTFATGTAVAGTVLQVYHVSTGTVNVWGGGFTPA